MMKRALSLLLAMGLASVAAAKLPNTGFYDLKPVVFIVLDSSGSMAYTEQELVTPTCTLGDAPEPDTTYGYSRDMIAKEVLTGTFNGFWCQERKRPLGRYDEDYPIPWLTPEFTSQSDDGVIDTNKERIKFGLATFDTLLSGAVDQTGGWSLGPDGSTFPGIGPVNVGLQNDTAPFGRLIVPTGADDFQSIQDNNQLVQTEVLGTIPFGGTPISPSLMDTQWLFENHPRFTKKTVANTEGDPYALCRAKNVLLITDGRPTLGESDMSYPTSVTAAEKLFKNGNKVYVVGFNLEAGLSTIVDQIADAGGTTKAHIASTPAQLATALSAILGKATPGVHTRTDTVATNITNSDTDLQYQLNTAYSAAVTSDIDLRGYAEVTSYRCEEGCKDPGGGAGACELTEARTLLDEQPARALYFTLDGRIYPLEKTEVAATPDALGIPTFGPLPVVVPTLVDGVQTTSGASMGDASDPGVRLAFTKDLIDFLHGRTGSRREHERLGGIWHSTPAVQTNLENIEVPIPSFTAYKLQQASRPTMAYFATHEGFVHAIHLSQPGPTSPAGTTWLQEMWAIAPQQAITRAYGLVSKLDVLMDGPLVVKDIRLAKTSASMSVEDEAKLWRSVVVAPYRQGGRGIFAIDVTDPFKPFVRWEISNTRHCWRNDDSTYACKPFDDDDVHDYRNLGYTHGRPKVGSVFITNPDTNKAEEIAAVFYPCGDGISGEPQSGKCFMVSRLDNGNKLREFKNGNDSVQDDNDAVGNVTDALDFDIVGDPAAYNTFVGTFVTRLFVGDEGGQLWRIDVSAKDPVDWRMQFFFDPFYDFEKAPLASKDRSPLRDEPAMSPVPQRGQLVLVFGTGNLDYATDLTQKTIVYSIKEDLHISNGLSTKVTTAVNWKRELEGGENLTSKPIIYSNVAYFTSYEPDPSDACNGGTGRIWGLDFLAHDADGDAIGKFLIDPNKPEAATEFIELADSIPYGISLISRPACAENSGIKDSVSNNAKLPQNKQSSALKASKPGQTELVVQTGSTGKTSTSSLPAKGGSTPTVNKFHQALANPPKQVVSVGWGQIQNL